MWFGAFFTRALFLSLAVVVYWLPVLVITAYGVTMVGQALWDEPIGLLMLFVLFVQPILVILSILAIRGGMTALDVTNGADIGRLFSMTWRVMRFNVPLMWAVTSLFGLATTLTGLKFISPDYISNVMAASTIDTAADVERLLEALAEFRIILFSGWAFGFSVAVAALGVSVAGASAMVASRPPNHHSIWGIGSQFGNLLGLGLIVIFLPVVVTAFFFGGTSATVAQLIALGQTGLYAFVLYALWGVCVMAAGIALAYSLTVKNEEAQRQADMEALAGIGRDRPKVDLAALRRSRMHNHD